MSTQHSGEHRSVGLNDEFVQGGHHCDDLECSACRPDYPRRCACGGLIHTQAHAHTGLRNWESLRVDLCCDECGPAYQEDDSAEDSDRDEP